MKAKRRMVTALEMYKAPKTEHIRKKKQDKKKNKNKSKVVSVKGKVLNGPSDRLMNPTLVKNMKLLTENQIDSLPQSITKSLNQEVKKKNKKIKAITSKKQVNGSSIDYMNYQIKPITEKRHFSPDKEEKKKKKIKREKQKNITSFEKEEKEVVPRKNNRKIKENGIKDAVKKIEDNGAKNHDIGMEVIDETLNVISENDNVHEAKKKKKKKKEKQKNVTTSFEKIENEDIPKKNNKKIKDTIKKIKANVTKDHGIGIEVNDKILNNISETNNLNDSYEVLKENKSDSLNKSYEAFKWMIYPQKVSSFFKKHWEKEPLYIERENRDYYKGVFSTADFDKILREQFVQFTKNINITSYSDGKRETHDPEGRAFAPVVWDYYNNGCSVRMLNPQTFHKGVWKLLSTLQEYFNSFCGANVYLTPPGTQGFAPHWDDIEAFILQLEGKKHWRIYKPRTPEEILPGYSSENLNPDEIGEVYLDVILKPGDMIYFPRGWIHQAFCLEDCHSLHMTVSTYQKNSWGTYLGKLLPHALSVATEEDVEFRKGLPRDYLNYMGIVHSDKGGHEGRKVFAEKVSELVKRMLMNAPYDVAADQMGVNFIHDCLPPFLTKEDKEHSIFGGGEHWCKEKMKVENRTELEPDTPIRLIRGNCIRVVAEEDIVKVYHTLENSREYHADENKFVEVSPEHAPAIECLIDQYPKFISVEELPMDTQEEKMAFASGLWERGIVVTEEPLISQYDD